MSASVTQFPGLTANPQRGARRTRYPVTIFQAAIYKHNGAVFNLEADSTDSKVGRVSSDIIQATMSKTITNPQGQWSLNLVPRGRDWLTELDPGDWCEIQADNGDGNGLRRVFYGPVCEVRESINVGEKGMKQTRIGIHGADFGRAIAQTSAIYDPALAAWVSFGAQIGLSSIVTAIGGSTGSPGEVLAAIINHYLTDNQDLSRASQWVDPRNGLIFGANTLDLNYIENANIGGGHAPVKAFNVAQSLWQTLEQWSNPAVNELFCDLRPPYNNPGDLIHTRPAIVLRQYPFWGNAWAQLPEVVVDTDEVTSSDFGKSDSDVINWIRPQEEVTGVRDGTQVYAVAADGHAIGMVNKNSIKRFGFRRHEIPSSYVLGSTAATDSEPVTIPNVLQKYTGLQAQWHHSNEKLLSGSITTYFRPDIRVGYKLSVRDSTKQRTLQFYVEGVTHSLTFPGPSFTNVTLTRGRDVNDDYFAMDLNALQANGVLQPLDDTLSRVAGELALI